MNKTKNLISIPREEGRSNPCLSASKRFNGFAPETDFPTRELKVEGGGLEWLRRRREMLKSLPPDDVIKFIEFHESLSFLEAVALSKGQDWLLVPNKAHDRLIVESAMQGSVFTGTAVVYEANNKPFGEIVLYRWRHAEGWTTKTGSSICQRYGAHYSLSFAVPEEFRGKKNCLLVVEHPDFDIVTLKGNNYELAVADASAIHLLENVPRKSGRYKYDDNFRIPSGKNIHSQQNLRNDGGDWRVPHMRAKSYIGPIAHQFYTTSPPHIAASNYFDWGGWRSVNMEMPPSEKSRVALF